MCCLRSTEFDVETHPYSPTSSFVAPQKRKAGSRQRRAAASGGRVGTPTLAVCLRRERGDDSVVKDARLAMEDTRADVPVRRRRESAFAGLFDLPPSKWKGRAAPPFKMKASTSDLGSKVTASQYPTFVFDYLMDEWRRRLRLRRRHNKAAREGSAALMLYQLPLDPISRWTHARRHLAAASVPDRS